MTKEEFLVLISQGLKNKIKEEEIFSNEIRISYLKKIDKIFNKGLNYYLDPTELKKNKEASIFFRKTKFDTELNIGAIKIVNHFEDLKISLSAIAKLSEIDNQRIFPICKVQENPKEVAQKIRSTLSLVFYEKQRDFLKSLIEKLAEYNILVFEFIETWNKKNPANIDGFFLNPNVIVLKRNQKAFRREIFTLAHELGHYLLNQEEIDQLDILDIANHNLSKVEKWCNDFAFYFLAGEQISVIENLETASSSNDYHLDLVENISKNTHLSKIAIFTRLLYNNKISQENYNKIKADFDEKYRLEQEEKDKRKELDKQNGIKQGGSTPKPIQSPLFISTLKTAFYEGVINEYEFCKRLDIKPENINKYIL